MRKVLKENEVRRIIILIMPISFFTMQKLWRDIVKGSVASMYNTTPTKAVRKKIAWQWPLELNDMVCMVTRLDHYISRLIGINPRLETVVS